MVAYDKAIEKLKTFNVSPYLIPLRAANSGAIDDVLNTNGCANYQFIPNFVSEIKPKQIVELGGAMGVWDIMVLNGPYQDFRLYSITLEEGGLEFSYVVDKYDNFTPIIGDDLQMSNWGELDLRETDLWYFDSLHTEEHLRKELDLYSPFFKKGCYIIFDDIHSFGLDPVWEDVKKGKYGKMECVDATDPLHYSGYGVTRYG